MKQSLTTAVTGLPKPAEERFVDFVQLQETAVKLGVADPTGLLQRQIPMVAIHKAALATFNASFDGSDTGTGKTYVAAVASRELFLRPAIVCPKSVIPAWKRVCESLNVKPLFVMNYESLKGGRREWLSWVTHPALGRVRAAGEFHWNLPPDALLVFDEGHRCKGTGSLNSKMLVAAKKQRIRTMLLSATAASSPLEMQALGYLLGLHNLHDFLQWCRHHGAETGSFGGLVFDATRNQRTMLAIHHQIFPRRGARMRIADIPDFPESLVTAEAYSMGNNEGKINDVYAQMQQEIARLDARSANYSGSIFAIIMEARMRSELLKIPALVEMVEDAIEEGMSVPVFLNFRESIESMATRLKAHNPGLIIGGQGDERQQYIDEFNLGQRRVIVANMQAGGVGISLHDVHGNFPRLSIISPNYSAIQLVQAVGRVWREGSKSKSVQRIVFASGTIEESACRAVRMKLKNLAALNDGDLKAGLQI